MKGAHMLQCFRYNRHIVLAEESSVQAVVRPDHILDSRYRDLGQLFLLLNIIQHNSGGGKQEKAARSAEIDILGVSGSLERLRRGIAQIFDIDLLAGQVEDCESVASNKHGGVSMAFLKIGRFNGACGISRNLDQLVRTAVRRGRHKDRPLSRVVGQSSGRDPGASEFLQGEHRRGLCVLGEIVAL